MPGTLESSEMATHARKSLQKPKVLLMCQHPMDAAMWTKLLRSNGCTARVCSDFIELLLCLERELFHLVMVLESDTPAPRWRTAVEFIAQANQGTPFFVINRNGEATGLSPSMANLN